MKNETGAESPGRRLAHDLPYLRRYARALTGSQATGDLYARLTLEALIADPASIDEAASPRLALFATFHAIWSSGGRRIVAGAARGNAREAAAQARLDVLTPRAREAVLLHTMEGLTVAEIAMVFRTDKAEAGALLDIGLAEMAREILGRVMIIEDEPIIALDIEAIVTAAGHEVTGSARTRDEASALARAARPDLLLADVQLADGSSGIDAAQDILGLYPDLPVVFITAFPERLLTAERPEPAFLITKPFTEEQVRLAVSQSMFFAGPAAP